MQQPATAHGIFDDTWHFNFLLGVPGNSPSGTGNGDPDESWLVVEPPTPLKNDGVRQIGSSSQLLGKNFSSCSKAPARIKHWTFTENWEEFRSNRNFQAITEKQNAVSHLAHRRSTSKARLSLNPLLHHL